MSNTAIVPLAADIERVLVGGDLAKLTPEQRITYYNRVCESIGLNPMTKPFDYLNLNGKTVLYANRTCADQLRAINGVSIFKVDEQELDGVYIVTVYAQLKDGRQDSDKGAVNIANLKGDARANAILKAITKAKRRVTLSICGLGWLDETEVETIPGAYRVVDTGEALEAVPSKEAQDAYLQKRLEEVRKPKDTVPEPIKEWANIDPEVTPQTIEMRHAAEVAEADAILSEATAPKSKKEPVTTPVMTFERLKKMREIKDRLRELTGTDTIYYATLKAKGYEHANRIDKERDAMAIWKLLQAEINRLTQESELLALFEQSAEVIGQRAFSDLLGAHGCIGIQEALKLAGDPLAELLTELKAAVDDRQSPKVP